MSNVFLGILVLSSIVMIVAVLMAEPKTKGMGSLTGADTNIFGSGGKKTREALINKVIIGAFCLFIISAVLIQL